MEELYHLPLPTDERPRWFDPLHTEALAECLPDEPNVDEPVDKLAPNGWLDIHVTRPLSADMVPRFDFRVTNRAPESNEDAIRRIKKYRAQKRSKSSFNTKVNADETERRVFSLRIRPTTEQKRLFQRAFSIARLAKKLAYQQVGDQRLPLSKKRILAIKKAICTETLQTRQRIDPESETDKRVKITGYAVNETLAPTTRRILFESSRPKKDRLMADVRTNAVLKFCQAVNSTRAAMEEKTLEWDRHMDAHQRWLCEQRQDRSDNLASSSAKGGKRKHEPGRHADGERRVYTRKYPPKGERPEMTAHQIKPPDRNRPRHSFSIDAKTTNTNNPYSARWDNDDGVVLFMKQKLSLWGCPSKRRRELERLSARMPKGEHATRTQTTLRYLGGRYHLMIQCLTDKVAPRADTEAARFVGLDPGVRTFLASYDHEGQFGTIGDGQVDRLIRVAKRGDRIKAHIDTKLIGKKKKKKHKRAKARKRVRQVNAKCRDLKADAHWKTARVLCQRYDDIMLPKFNSQAAMRFLGRTTTRKMLFWSHYEFRQRLQHKAKSMGARVHLVSEHQTTITCGRCFHIEATMRKNPTKWFQCRRCGYAIDRDANAARNVAVMNVERCVGKLEPHAINDDEDEDD